MFSMFYYIYMNFLPKYIPEKITKLFSVFKKIQNIHSREYHSQGGFVFLSPANEIHV